MYKYKNYEYTLEEIQEAADKKNLSVEEYIKEYNIDPPATEIKTEVTEEVITDPTKEGKKKPTTGEDVTVVEEIAAPENTELVSENGSLESQEIDNSPQAIFKRRKQAALNQAKVLKKPVELKEVVITFDSSEKNTEELMDNLMKIDDRIKLIAGDDMQIDALDSPKRIKEYSVLSTRRKQINDNLRNKLKDEGSTKSLLRALKKGDKTLGEYLLSMPSFAYEIGSLVSDPVNRALGLPETDLTKFEESIGTRSLLDSLIEEQEKLSKIQEEYKDLNKIKGGIGDNFSNGNWEDGFYLLGETLAESAPVSLSLMFGGAAGLSRTALTLGGGVPMAAGEMRTQREEYPEQEKAEMLLKSTLIGLSEGFFEGIFGSGAIGKTYKNIIAKEGVEKGTEIFKKGIISMYEGALQKFGVPIAAVSGGLEEVGTQITQNLINGKSFNEGVTDAFLAGVGGGGLYGAPVNLAKGVELGRNLIQEIKVNAEIKPTEYTNISYAFDPIEKTTETQIKLSQLKNSDKVLQRSVNNEIKKGNITQEQGDAIEVNFRNTQGAVNQLKSLKLNEQDQASTVQLIKEKTQLKNEIEQVGESNLTIEQSDRIKEIDQNLKKIGSKAVTQQVEKIKEAAKDITNLDVQEFATTTETEAFLNKQDQDIKASSQQGFIIQNKDGKQTIVINREIADKEIAVAAPAHEFLHAILYKTVKDSPATALQLGNSLMEYITKIDINQVKNSNFAQRLQQYQDQPAEVQAEEALTLFSDAILTGDIKFKENIFTKLRDVISKILQVGGVKARFNTGRDVYNFIKDYNKSIQEGKLTSQQIKTAEEGVKLDIKDTVVKETETIIKESKSEKTSQSLLDRLNTMIPATIKTKEQFDKWIRNPKNYGDKEVAITNSYVNSLVKANKLTREQADIIIDELPIKILNFNPAAKRANGAVVGPEAFGERIFSGVYFAKKTANKKLRQTSEKKSQEERREDREDGFETLAAPEVEVEVEVAEKAPAKKLKEVKETLSKENQTELKNIVAKLNLTEDQLTFKTLPNAAIEIFAKQIGIPAKKFDGKANFTKNELDKVINFIEENISTIRQALPEAAVAEGSPVSENLIGTATGVPNNLLKDSNLYTRQDRGTRLSGLIPYTKNKGIDNSSILKAIGNVDGRRMASPRDKQAQTAKGLINMLAKFATNQEVRKQKTLTPQQKSNIEVGKGSRLLFSKPLSKVFGLSANEAFSFSNISDINSGRIELKNLSSSMIKDIGIQDWINIIDPVISRQYKIGDKQLLDDNIGFNALELTEEEFNKNKNILLERSAIDGKKRYNQFLTRGRKDYYENILANALNKDIKWIPRKGIEVDGTIYKTPIVPKQTPGGFTDKNAWDSSLPKRIKFAENQQQGFKKIIQKLTNTYQNSNKSKKNKVRVGMVLNTFNSNINGLIRTAAIPGLDFRVKGLNKDSDYRYEHTQPASETLRQLAKIIVGNKNAQTFEEIMENFRVAIIPKIYDDVINKVRVDGELLRSTSPLDENKNLQKPIESTKPTRYEAAAKAIANAGLAPLILTDVLPTTNKDQLKLKESKAKASIKNNLELPKSQRLPKDSTNEQVLTKMQELDDQANKERIKYSKSQNLDETFNNIIEAKTGIETYKRFSPAKATVRGASKGKFNFFIPPSAEDFVGLLYKTLGKGKVGDSQMQFYKDNLLDPYGRAMNDISSARVAMFEDYKTLKEDLKIIPKDLKKKGFDEYTREQAVRAYIWDQQGNKIPGLFKTDQQGLVDYVNNDAGLKTFADQLIAIQKGDQYSSPNEGWLAGSITTDLLDSVNSIKRKKYLEQWQTNVDEVFSEVNMNKLEAAFGKPYREALTNILTRMKTGRNKPFTSDSLAGRFTNWLNNSVGAIMFFNTRSAALQLLSSVNFVNFTDNNPLKAGAAFANQPQYWKDFKFLFNSDFLKERRGGLRFNVSESEIADAAKKGGAKGVISKILQAGFLPTQMADSFAIATGGASFYRNRVKTYIKQGLTEAEAAEKAFQDFRETAEESQQSSRPDRISAQQAGPLGRTILAFANTPAQYARLTKKAASDLINGRGDLKTNISKLAYYGFVQNLAFNFLQQAVFALAFGDESEEEEKKKQEKYIGVANGMADGFLRGIGISGAIISTLKNALIKIIKEDQKARPDYAETAIIQLLGISPPVQSKAQKLRSALKSYEWNKDEMKEKGFSLDNPAYLAGANVISASTNIPLDRVVKKVDNIRSSTRDDITTLNRMMLLAGWSDWQLDIQKEKPKKKKSSRRSSSRSTSRSSSRSSNKR